MEEVTLPLHIQHREREGVEILELHGRHTMGQEDLLFRAEFRQLLAQNRHRLVLDCKDVDDIDSVGVGTLIWAQETLQKLGGKLALSEVKIEHLEILVTLKLEAFFEVFESEIEAVNSFFPDRHVERVDVLKLVRRFMAEEKEMGETQK